MIIRDQIFGNLEFDDIEKRIIDTPEFQRLRRIKQMSVTTLVYPGANHTRFEHSLGTAHLAELIAKKTGLDEDHTKKIKLYALLHDIGHVPFSHEGEDILEKYIGNHEKLGKEKIMNSEIKDILGENYKPKSIISIGETKQGSIVTSDLGADRMDYLQRDALNTGVAYGIIDIDRIVHTLILEKGELCISEGGLEAAETLLIARFMMFSTVYLHDTVRIATAMLYRAIENSITDGSIEPKEFAVLDDETAIQRMAKSDKAKKYANALLNRELYKEVVSFSKENRNQKQMKELEKKLSKQLKCDIIVDHPHQFSKPIQFKVKTEQGLKRIVDVSKLVDSLKKSETERMHVLVLIEERLRNKMKNKIRTICSEYF